LSLKSISLETDGESALSHNHAVLCTDDTTFNLRQVHSSNSVHLIVPTQPKTISSIQSSGDLGLKAIAQCATTLELVPFIPDATSILKEILPLYNGTPALADRGIESGECSKPRKGNKQQLFENVPLSRQEFEGAWLDICAFETNGHACAPSTLDRSGIWKSIMSVAALENADLVVAFDPDSLKNIVVEQDAYPEDFFDAVLRRLCKDWSSMTEGSTSLVSHF
jgi:sister chromatid cohesion protein DCC1